MALKNRKLSEWTQAVSSLDDKPRMTAKELKAAFDSNSNELKPAINGIIDDLTGVNGASNIGLIAINGVNGQTVQAVLNALAVFSQNTNTSLEKLSTSKGASLIGTTAISGISGSNVQAVLQSIATLAQNTKLNLDKLSTSQGAGLIGISPINGLDGDNIQEILKNIWNGIMQIETGDPNEFQYLKKTEKGAAGGLATLDNFLKLSQSQIPDIDCGNWDLNPVDIHSDDALVHLNMIVDGNNTVNTDISQTLEQHINNPNAHQNLNIDGNNNA